tara:strand:+ start:103 stop:345 length:243 start_codon:yes stop_codon:yes gene_type:complete
MNVKTEKRKYRKVKRFPLSFSLSFVQNTLEDKIKRSENYMAVKDKTLTTHFNKLKKLVYETIEALETFYDTKSKAEGDRE